MSQKCTKMKNNKENNRLDKKSTKMMNKNGKNRLDKKQNSKIKRITCMMGLIRWSRYNGQEKQETKSVRISARLA